MSLQIQDLCYIHSNKDILFQNISFSISSGEKCAIVGNNGIGKSTLLNILAGRIAPANGKVSCSDTPYMIPQHFGRFNSKTVGEVLGVAAKIHALSLILDGRGTEDDFIVLDDEWDIQERISEAFAKWNIDYVTPHMLMDSLSGGEKTKVFLAGLNIYNPAIVLMDEPTNNLDTKGRNLLYEFIRTTNSTTIIVSHDRPLLNRLSAIYEMSSAGMRFYPMNYSEYKETVDAENAAKVTRLQNRQKELLKAEKLARKTMERQQKHASRGEKQSAGKCTPRISMGLLRNKSEASTARLNKVQQEKLHDMNQKLNDIRASISDFKTMKIDIGNSASRNSKRLVEATNVTFRYADRDAMWEHSPLNFSIYSGERIRIQGDNGSGKSTLLKLIAGVLQPADGQMWRSDSLDVLYLDQDYSCVDNEQTVYGLLETYSNQKPEHELKMLLNRFLFTKSAWDKKCGSLSGGERMKLALCRLLIFGNSPDIIIVDEPTNNIDISSMDILADTLKNYKGTLLVVSHDEQFVHDVGVERVINL